MRILVVEDDELNSYVLSAILSNQNYAVEVAHDGDMAWDLIETYDYDLILSDIMLPKLDGISLCRKIRSSGRQMPVLLLTGCNSSHEKAIGLDAGADDYVVKPFEQEELVARVRALLRRSGTTVQPILEWGNLQLDPSSCEVHYADNLLSLTPKEYALLELFLRNNRRLFSCGMILEHLWSYEDTPGEEAVRTHIKGLRQKLKAVGAPGDLIETVYGIGYRLKQQEDEAKKSQEVEQPKTKKSQPPQELPTPEQTLAAIAGIWQKFQGRVDEQVRIIEQAIALIQTGLELSDMRERLSPAVKEAHTLAGSLGTFGLPEGSRLARQIEQLLKSNQPWQPDEITNLQNWVKLLRQEITAKADSTTNLPTTAAELPGDGTLKNNLAQAEAKILAVDDDPQILALLQTLLPPWGLQVITLNDPRQFWETLTTVAPDLLILDIEMPHIGGLELCQEVRHDPSWSELPILFLTVHSDAEILNQVFSVGADDFVNKPIIGPELVTRIINRLERVKLLRRVTQKVGSEGQGGQRGQGGQGDKNDYASPSPSSAISREITQYHEIEAEIRRVNRTLQTLSSCNQEIIRATEENKLLEKICQVLVEIGGYRLAWVGFAENDPEKNILPVAQAGYEDGYLQSLNLTWSDTVNGQGPIGTAIRTSEISIIQNIAIDSKYEIWRCQANQRGYAASIALPLKADGKAFGALSIYAGEPNAFDADEVKLLDELGENLSYGIVALRNQRDRELLQKNGQLAEAALQQANNELELRVAERTAELVNVNRQLQSQLNERQRIEEILRISQVRLARILDIADDAIISIDSSQCITLFNQGAEKIFGYTAHDIIGQKLDVLLPMRFAEAHRHHVVDFGQSPSLARRMGERREIFGRRQDGSEFPAEASISKFHLGSEFFYTVILRDITERKQIDRMKDEFVSVVSHELRTPLTSIHGSLGMLASGLLKPDSAQGQRLLQIATDSTERLVRLINDILDIERIESGKVKMEHKTCHLGELINSAVSLMQPLANKAEVTLSISSSPLQIWADPDRIVQTLTNLLSNAIKFSSPGSQVWLTTQQQGDEVLVIIKDTGRGIPTDKLESIFERFQQVDSSDSRNHDGTGLGLAICQSIVQQHGGRIWAESVLGEGSTFYLALPILSAETTAK
ncbi:MAG: response regulator [Nostoc sp. LLA-1]|nr:response regulator [Cyanocohniella sp. LLY]